MSQIPHAYNKYELLFTPHLIPTLEDLRGEEWQDLVESLSRLPETHPDALAFSLMMIDLDGCMTCEMDSYRAQRGCEMCARQAIMSFKGTDTQLINRFNKARVEVSRKIENLPPVYQSQTVA
jgi:hypothetical protein